MRILLVEDDRELCSTVALQLEAAGYETDRCYQGDDALYYVSNHPYDVLVFDLMLPQLDGLTLLKKIRAKDISAPVIKTTALDGLHDRIDGLDAGADDYLVKPYAVEELLARIRAVARRPSPLAPDHILTFSNLSLDTQKKELSTVGTNSYPTTLSRKESALLEYFIRNAGQTLPRGLILSYVWGPDCEVEDGNLDNYIYFLRRRLQSVQSRAAIKTVHGTGYRLEETHD